MQFIYANKFISLNSESKFNIHNLENFKIENSIDLKINSSINTFYPTSIARINDIFFVSYSNGEIISFNLQGKINWKKNFNDLIKTPLKIFKNNLIVLLSNKIISINLFSGDTNWEFLYESENVLQAKGGDIINLNHLLFFILPNSRIGTIDTIFGEKIETILSDNYFENSTNNSFDKLHSYKNFLSYFDQNKYLTTIDVNHNKILLNRKQIYNVNSFIFFNNSLLTFHNKGILKISNIINRNIFREINILDIVDKDDEIINISTYAESLILFFRNGAVIEMNTLDGKLISHKNLKIKNILKITIVNKYLLAHQENGNTTIFSL